jgi:hypothetical protein
MKESEFNTVGKDLTLNDVNKDIVITPFELEKTWKDVYGEDFKTEYSGVHSYLTKNYKNFTIEDLVDVWERMYGEDFLQEYPGISRWLFSNQGKTSSKDKVAPKMNEDDMMSDKDFVDANWDGDAETLDWEKDIEGKQVGNWTADMEPQAGSIVWESPKYNALIYATPGWEGANGIAVEMYELDADGYMDGEPVLQKVIGSGTDAWKTEEGYMALMAKVFTTLEKMLTPSDNNMAEDHGRQIDHDKLDNISKDPSEFEDTVYEDVEDQDRFDDLGGDIIKSGIESLLDDGFDYREIIDFVKNVIKATRKGGVN